MVDCVQCLGILMQGNRRFSCVHLWPSGAHFRSFATDPLHRNRNPSAQEVRSRQQDATDIMSKYDIYEGQSDRSKVKIVGHAANGFQLSTAEGEDGAEGAVILLPRLVLQVKMNTIKDLTVDKLHVLAAFHPRLEVVIFGTGTRIYPLAPEIGEFLRKNKINFDVMDTPNACATFNVLVQEDRRVAAFLVPPSIAGN